MGEKANLIETPAAAPSLLGMATDAAASTASDLANAAVVGVSGVVTLEVHDRLKGQIDDEATKPPAGEENAGGAK